MRWSEDARAHLAEDSRPNDEKLRNEYRRIIALQDAIARSDIEEVTHLSAELVEAKSLFQFILDAVQKSEDAPIAHQRSLIDQVHTALEIYPY